MSTSGSPPWLVALLVLCIVSAVVSFGVFLERHAQAAAYQNQFAALKLELRQLRERQSKLIAAIPELEAMIRDRRLQIAELEEHRKTWLADINRLVEDNRGRQVAIGDAVRRELRTYNDLMREAPERRREVGSEEERAYTQELEIDDSLGKLRDEIATLARDLEVIKKRDRSELVQLDARIAELEERTRFLTRQVDLESREMRPDGVILSAHAAANGYVVIDKGRRNGLRRGLRFSVFTMRAGKPVDKGSIEVLSVEERIGICRVLEERDRNDPLIAGDRLHNPIWDPDRVRSFALHGDYQRFTRTELASFITAAGGIIHEELRPGTDFLVAGARAERWTELAIKLGVPIISEQQLLEFIRPQE
ncbi:MAG: BRCT domain-containing protein [Planctomycetota bacterium]|nr:BRCT domain-containing protein [Planctomycetota bacterium]